MMHAMTSALRSLAGCAGMAVLAASTVGCLCPPCPGAPGVAPPNNAGNAMNAAATTPAAPAGPVAVGSKLMIWDGDGAGAGAQSWETCDKAPNCEVKVAADPGSGVNGSTSLKMHGKGPGFIGLGWNIFGWYPENAGVDLTPYTHLTFQIRIDAKTPADAPDPGSVGVLLGCSKNKKDSATLPVERFAKGFSDGKWHKVSMPIAAFVKGPGAQFDLGSFWEFRVATWSMSPRNFDLYIDEIAAEKQ
jgi:hypothetical protein